MPELQTLLVALVEAALIVAAVVILTRLNGLRTFSKMSGFDFAITVAMGSVIAATVVSPDRTIIMGAASLAALIAVQAIVAVARVRIGAVQRTIDNSPLLIMDGDSVLHGNLRMARMTEADLRAKLREANVLDPREVRAVVLESTGDVSVLHGQPGGNELTAWMLDGVRRT